MVKIVRQSFANYSVMTFILMSYALVYTSYSISKGESALSLEHLKHFTVANYYFAGTAMVTLIGVWKLKSWSKFLNIIFFLYSLYYLLQDFTLSQNKVILLLLFLYLLHSFLFYLIYDAELKSPANNPLYFHNQVDLDSNSRIPVNVYFDDGAHAGYLTNWGPHACFVSLNEKLQEIPSGKAKVSVAYGSHLFEAEGYVSSYFCNGIGLRFVAHEMTTYNWKLLVSILNRKGFLPV
ncbi:MAG: hypothetical protein Fur0010_07430 [Bdellovibrio sp.]